MSRRRALPARCRWPRRPLAVAALLVLGALVVSSGPAAAAVPVADRASVGRASPGQAVGPAATSVVVLVDTLAPRVVTTDGPGALLVTGRVVNTGALAVRDVSVRLQRGAGVSAERDVAAALAGRDPAEEVRTAPSGLTGLLAPGATVPFSLTVPLRGAGSLALPGTGLFPTLVAATGTPADGAVRRLDAERFLLPVLALPPAAGAVPAPRAVPAAGRATRVGLLYPLVDRPRRVPTAPGAPPLLSDDDLAASFAPGGRLAGLVDALGRAAPVGSPAAASVCLAVDADLLETARVMTGPYGVSTPTGPVAGRGQDAATTWLAAVGRQARGRCVVAVPYADADLLTTSAANLTDLTTYARTEASRRVADLLGVDPLPDATWPSDGRVDERTLSDLATGGARTLVVDAAGLGSPASSGGAPVRLPGAPGSSVLAVPTDPLAAGALAGAPGRSGIGTSPAGTSQGLSVQDALATLVMRVTDGDGDTDGEGGGPPPATLLAPPARWDASTDEAAALLGTISDLARRGLAAPADVGSLARAAEADATTPTAALAPGQEDDLTSGDEGPGPIPSGSSGSSGATDATAADDGDTLIARTRAVRDEQRDLLAASRLDRPGSPTPADFLDPLTGDLLRALSAARRDDSGGRSAAVAAVGTEMDDVRSLVRVVQPSGSYSLGANDAPLLLTVENRLPVAVDVDVVLDPVPGLRASPLPVERVPAFGSRQFRVAIELTRSGSFSVDARARTPGGESLGPTSRLLLRSTAYGTITVWLTASAAAVLVVLATVRIFRRVRTSRREGRAVSGSGAGSPRQRPDGPTPLRSLERR